MKIDIIELHNSNVPESTCDFDFDVNGDLMVEDSYAYCLSSEHILFLAEHIKKFEIKEDVGEELTISEVDRQLNNRCNDIQGIAIRSLDKVKVLEEKFNKIKLLL